MNVQRRLLEAPTVGLYSIPLFQANQFLEEWGHKLGPCVRPFYSQAFALEVHGSPVCVAISASVVNHPVAGYHREQLVELARLGARVGWANRVMLRLWREVCAPMWPCWKAAAAVSYSLNAMHRGDLYRFDGWEKIREDCGSGGGGTWSTPRREQPALSGRKTLWLYRLGDK